MVEDSEILDGPDTGQNNCHNGIGFGGFTVRRTEISGCENGATFGGTTTSSKLRVHDLDTTGPSYVWVTSSRTRTAFRATAANVPSRAAGSIPTQGDDGNAGIFAPGG